MTESRTSWKTVKPLLADESTHFSCNRGREHKKTNIDEIKSISKSWSRKASQKVIWIQTFWGKTRLFCSIYMRWYQYLNSLFKVSCWNKESDFTPVHKKMSKLFREYCRPISILPDISKVYERCLYDQMSSYFEDIFSKYQCGFRKGYSAQHCLLVMIEKWKK